MLGVGLDVMWSRLTLRQLYPWLHLSGSGGTEPDGLLQRSGVKALGMGNVGITWKITERQTPRSDLSFPDGCGFDGDVDLSNITPTAAVLALRAAAISLPKSHSQISWPSVTASSSRINSGSNRCGMDSFSRFESLPINAGNNTVILPPSSQNIPQNWRDTFTLGIAGDYQLSEHWVVRAGYQFYQSPFPIRLFLPRFPMPIRT